MANPASVAGLPAVIVVTDVAGSFTVDPDREYTLKHDGEKTNGSASTAIIYLAYSAAVDPDGSEGADKAKLCSGDSLVFGPGLTQIKFDAAAADEATMTVIPGPRLDVDGHSNASTGLRANTSASEEILVSLDASTASLALLDDSVATHLGAGPTKAQLTGGLAVSGVPTEETAGDIAAPWMDRFRRRVGHGANLSEGTNNVTIVSTVKPAPLIDSWAALTAPAQETPPIDVRDHANHTITYTIASIDTSVTLKLWFSPDNETTWILLIPAFTLLADGSDYVEMENFGATHMKFELDAEAGGVAVTVTFKYVGTN